MKTAIAIARLALCSALLAPAFAMDVPGPVYAQWSHGPSASPDSFPIAVWLQSPSNAQAYKNAGVNLFIGLWAGPTEAQLADLSAVGMQVMCDQNAVGLNHLADPTIVGWTQDDEPDNAQPAAGGGYGPPVLPSVIVSRYNAIKAADPTRPVYLNVGQSASYTTWYGRGTRTGHTEDYPQYFQGADLVSFDIYPVNDADTDVTGHLWFVPQGIDNLTTWSGGSKPAWCWIECTRIGLDSPAMPTPAQVRSEAWMALIHGANGLGYFCHSWNPTFDEPALLHEPAMLTAVTALNAQITSLAAVLNAATVAGGATVASSAPAVPVDIMVKDHGGFRYVFAASMRPGATTATLTVPGATAVEVIGESRTLAVSGGVFHDAFATDAVHLYRVTRSTGSGTGTTAGTASGTGGGSGSTGGAASATTSGTGGAAGGAPAPDSGGGAHSRCGFGSVLGLALLACATFARRSGRATPR